MSVSFSKFDVKMKVKLPKPTNVLLAYETGVHIGDGSLQIIKGKTHSVRFFGHAEDDWIFYSHVMPRIIKKIYNKEVRPTKRTDANTCILSVCSKAIATFKLNVVGLPNGNKNKLVEIPRLIKKKRKLLINCIRGIADSDFTLFFHKKNGKYMDPEISCTMANKYII